MYWGYYNALNSLSTLPPGSAVVFAPRQQEVTGADFGSHLPVAYLGASEQTFSNQDALWADLQDYKSWMDARGISPLAVTFEEEWYPRATHNAAIRGWGIFQGLSDFLVRQVVHTRLGIIYGLIKQMWPLTYTFAVEPVWYHDLPVDFYAPPPENVDVLGIDAYLKTPGDPIWSTPPLDDTTSSEMLRKFQLEVDQFVRQAGTYGRPVVVVGQAFRDTTPGSMWFKAPTPDQLSWFHTLAVDVQAAGIVWFSRESVDPIAGLDGLPELAARVNELAGGTS